MTISTLNEGVHETLLPEQRLWRAVLNQARLDLVGKATAGRGTAAERHRTVAWIGSQNFYTVCHLAGLNPIAAMAAFDALTHSNG
jgi:hypothetical protein